MPVTLVVPEERHPVELRIFARTEKARWQVPPKLYFRRLGKLAGQLFPMLGTLRGPGTDGTEDQKGRHWIAKEAVRMDGGRVRARLLQASRLEVQWFSREWIRNAGVLVQVSTSQGTKSMTLAPRLLRELSMDRAALAGTLVVPHGPASIECLAMEDMRTLWKRRLVAKNWLHRVRVESQD
ncbi:MAG: hypothetical protein ACE5F1_05780 [Planctomycetota bacterium]